MRSPVHNDLPSLSALRAFEVAARHESFTAAARELFDDAQLMLRRAVDEGLLRADAALGFWPAGATADDDIVVWADEQRSVELARLHTLRQQVARSNDRADLALSDFVAPVDSGVGDYVGAFAVTAGHGLAGHKARFEADHDDYNAIMAKALADRCAEAFAEKTLDAMNAAPIDNPGTTPRPGLPGVQYVGVPEFQDVGTRCTERFSAAIAGSDSARARASNRSSCDVSSGCCSALAINITGNASDVPRSG